MSFMLPKGWQVQFLEPDLKTPLPRRLTFAHADKIRELARRGEALGTLEGKQALESAIENGRGGLYLRLTPEQYSRLKRPCGSMPAKMSFEKFIEELGQTARVSFRGSSRAHLLSVCEDPGVHLG